jgi:tetratricopeptide (TPR) repeat protein
MSSAPSAPSSSHSTASPPQSVPVGVRTDAVVPGRWVAAALIAALALAVAVFFLLPAQLPSGRTVAPRDVLPPAPRAESPKGDPAESVRLRLLAEEAASRYREGSAALRERGAAAWAPEDLNAAASLADEAAAAASAGDHGRAIKNYEEADRRLAGIAARADGAYARALADGDAAIQAGVSAKAIEAFRLALAIRPGDKKAQQGLGRAGRLDEVRARLAEGEAQERAGKYEPARAAYAAALALDPEFPPARSALARVDGRLTAERFEALMTGGLGQLERSDWRGAEESFSAALKQRPADRAAADGLARAKEGGQRDALTRMQREAQEFESAERWEDALAAYQRAVTIDPGVDFAPQGAARSERMVRLHARIDGYLARPERLYSPRVRAEAQQLLTALRSEPAVGPRMEQARQRLAAALKRATTAITVRLTSDNATEVILFRVGPLGRFQDREIALTPGTYTLTGSRPGYKDVRVELVVDPDSPAPRVFVACEERV